VGHGDVLGRANSRVGHGDDVADLVTGVHRPLIGHLGDGDGCAVHRDVGLGPARAVVGGGEGGGVVQVGALGLVGGGDHVHRGGGPAGQGGRAVGEDVAADAPPGGGRGDRPHRPPGQGVGGGEDAGVVESGVDLVCGVSGVVNGGDAGGVGDLGHGHLAAVHRDVGLGPARAVVGGGVGVGAVHVGRHRHSVPTRRSSDLGGPAGQGGRAVGEDVAADAPPGGGRGDRPHRPPGQGV